MTRWPQVKPLTGDRARFPAGVESDYNRAHRLLCEAAQAVAALRGAYTGIEPVSELADRAFVLFEDSVREIGVERPRDMTPEVRREFLAALTKLEVA